MKSLQAKLMDIRDALYSTGVPTYHYERPESAAAPWIVWAEDGEESSFNGDNLKEEQQIHGVVDCYTQQEYDPLLDKVQEVLNGIAAGWSLTSVQYEDETKLIHYSWEFYSV